MAINTTEAFPSVPLLLIRQGVEKLGVPIVDGIVRIEELGIDDEWTNLTVGKDEVGSISVELTDGGPLRVEFIQYDLIDDQLTSTRLEVFEGPIDKLEFFKTEESVNGEPGWVASGEDLVVTDMVRLRSLANTIGNYVSTKQRARVALRAIVDHESDLTTS